MSPTLAAFVGVVVTIAGFAANMLWWGWLAAKHRAQDEMRLQKIGTIEKDLVDCRKDLDNVVLYLKMKNGEIAREIL